MPNPIANRTTAEAGARTAPDIGLSQASNPRADGSMVYLMPNLSNPRPPNHSILPILLLEYRVIQGEIEKRHSFGFKASAFQTVEMHSVTSGATLPVSVWQGKDSVLGLVFRNDAARAKCIKRMEHGKPFGLSLERDLRASFLLRNFSASSPGDDVELYDVQGRDHTIMSLKVGQSGFVIVDPSWSAAPRFVAYESVKIRGCAGNWVFIHADGGAKRPSIHIIECTNADAALNLAKSLTQHAQRQVSVSPEILAVTTTEIVHGDIDLAVNSHSEGNQPGRLPFNTAWLRFVESIAIPTPGGDL